MEKQSNHIELYLDHQLTPAERKLFDEKLHADETFAKEVAEQTLILTSFDEMQAQNLMARFATIEDSLKGGEESRLGFPIYLKWAATVTILAVLSLAIYLNSGPSEQDLFLSYYTPYPNMESPTSRSEASGKAVWQFYEKGDYVRALALFEEALAVNEADFGSRFYYGISALELNRLTVAEEAFSAVVADEENNYNEQAQWYLALTYLKAGNDDKSVAILQEIAGSGSTYQQKAKDLLRELG
jgi:tetratricopeptide (TPR) repeat protein